MLIVEVLYREVSREAWYGRKEAPYRWRFRSHAATPSIAIEAALAEFRHMEAISGVGWTRDIVEVRVLAQEVTREDK